jgi:hypothetical protein
MDYQQFLNLVIPCIDMDLARLCLNRKVHQRKFEDYDVINRDFKLDLFHREVVELFFMLIQKEVECIDNLYRIAADIYSLHGFEVMKALSAL